jgi:hypothetical protein
MHDLEIIYRRSPQNLDRLVLSLSDLKPYPHGAPPGLPFVWNRATLAHGLNFILETSLGLIDLLGEIPGGGRYEDLVSESAELEMFSGVTSCLSLDQLIRAKRAAGRPKDLDALAELEALREETGSTRE